MKPLSMSQGRTAKAPTSFMCKHSVCETEEGRSIAGKRKQTEQQPVILFSKNAKEDGGLRKYPEDCRPRIN